MRLGDVAREVRVTVNNPLDEGLERYVGLEHLDPQELRVRRWGNIADGVTFNKKFRAGQILFGRRRAYQKKAAVPYFDGICSGDITVIEAIEGAIVSELLPYIIQSDSFFEHAVSESAGSLSPRVKWKHLANYEFNLPDKDTQRKIAELMQAFDESIDSRREVLHATYELLEANVNDFCKRTKSDEQWSLVTLPEVVDINVATLKENTDPGYQFNYIDIESVTTGEIAKTKLLKFGEAPSRARRIVENGDVLVSMVRPYLKAFAVVNGFEKNIIASTGFAVLHPKRKGLSDYIFAFTISDAFYRQIRDKMTGTAYPAISAKDLEQVEMPIPQNDTQVKHITEILNSIIITSKELRNSIDATMKLKKGVLLKALFSGGDTQ